MFVRLRRIATVFKPSAYHYALVDYLINELRTSNIKCRKRTSHIAIKLDRVVDDLYNQVIIDCFNGNVYLRGETAKDKKILRLARFGGIRESDAMHCAKGGSKQIVRYIEKLMAPKQLEVEATVVPIMIDYRKPQYKDMRKEMTASKNSILKDLRNLTFKKTIDLRNFIMDVPFVRLAKCHLFKDMRKIAEHDTMNRDSAILCINGQFYENETHAMAINEYLEDMESGKQLDDDFSRPMMGIKPDEDTRDEFVNDLNVMNDMAEDSTAIAFAHKVDNEKAIYIEENTLKCTNMDKVKKLFKDKYPSYQIYNDDVMNGDEYLLIAKVLGITKTAEDLYNLYRKHIATDLRTEGCHRLKKVADMSRDFAVSIIDGAVYTGDTHAQAVSKYLADMGIEDIELFDRDEIDNNMCSQFAAAHVKESEIYIDQISFKNITIEQVVKLLHDKFPSYILMDYDTKQKLNIANKVLKDLRKSARHDLANRDSAIVYMNGKFYEAPTHAEAINNYMKNNGDKQLNEDFYRPKIGLDPNDVYDTIQKEDVNTINDLVEEIAFAHKVENEIYIEEETLVGIDMYAAAELFKDKYTSCDIYNDDVMEYNENIDEDEYEKVARLKKMNGHDVSSRDSAIIYVNGEIIEAITHAEAIKKYLQINSSDVKYFRSDKVFNDLEKNSKLAFAHKVEKTKIIFLERWTLHNVDIDMVADEIKQKYPEYTVYEDSDDEFDNDEFDNDLSGYEELGSSKKNNSNKNIEPFDFGILDPEDMSETEEYDFEFN